MSENSLLGLAGAIFPKLGGAWFSLLGFLGSVLSVPFLVLAFVNMLLFWGFFL